MNHLRIYSTPNVHPSRAPAVYELQLVWIVRAFVEGLDNLLATGVIKLHRDDEVAAASASGQLDRAVTQELISQVHCGAQVLARIL